MVFGLDDLWFAWTVCRSACERQLFSDPLLHAEFEIAGLPPGSDVTPQQVEVDVRTRPKQSGGVRAELFPDPRTATLLHSVAMRLQRHERLARISDSGASRSGRLAVANPYEEWSSAIRTWIRKELASGQVVICADIENFFPSIPGAAIADVLSRGGLAPDLEKLTLSMVDQLRKLGGRSRPYDAGLPVCPGDFFWIVADRVLFDVDSAVQQVPEVLGYTRWSDDFLLSAKPGTERAALRRLAICARHHGFKLNDRKTHVYSSWEDYQARNLVREHDSVSDLIAVHRKGCSKSEVEGLLGALDSFESADRQESGRLLSRVYNLAAIEGSTTLVDRAEMDLERYPTVERSLFRYLARLGWPEPGRALLLRAVRWPTHDTLALSALSALLNDSASPQTAPSIGEVLLDASLGSSPCRPLARVAAYACLVQTSSVPERERLTRDFLEQVPALGSASARRAALALAWLVPTLRERVATLVRDDDSLVVRDLWTCLGPSPHRNVRRGLDRVGCGSGRTRWGGLEKQLARALGG